MKLARNQVEELAKLKEIPAKDRDAVQTHRFSVLSKLAKKAKDEKSLIAGESDREPADESSASSGSEPAENTSGN